MKIEIIDAMIADGYTGAEIADFEMCNHHFQQVLVVNFSTKTQKSEVFCNKCNLDEHGAHLMGIDPMFYGDVSKWV